MYLYIVNDVRNRETISHIVGKITLPSRNTCDGQLCTEQRYAGQLDSH